MKHKGDITKIHGYDLEPVHCLVGGSPCQDLSVAGKRAGLAGERSGLFMEQIRIIKEMRYPERYGYGANLVLGSDGRPVRFPEFAVWENVPGALSSGNPKGADFAAVIEEFLKIENENAVVDVPEKGWPSCGCIYDEGGEFSLAYRIHDAQFWGVPQRRRRISLVMDFGGLRAPEILFEREGVRRDSEPGGEEREESAGRVEDSS